MRESRFPPFGFVSSEFGLCALVLLLSFDVFLQRTGGSELPITTASGAVIGHASKGRAEQVCAEIGGDWENTSKNRKILRKNAKN